MMLGYRNNDKATNEVVDEEGWYDSGDVGLVDEDHFIRICDRVKELIKLPQCIAVSSLLYSKFYF